MPLANITPGLSKIPETHMLEYIVYVRKCDGVLSESGKLWRSHHNACQLKCMNANVFSAQSKRMVWYIVHINIKTCAHTTPTAERSSSVVRVLP